jgi:hypothetical protein
LTVFAKSTTYGLDTKINELQTFLDSGVRDNLSNYWAGDLYIYGKIEPIERKGNINPEAYKGGDTKNKEYGEIFVNDKIACSIGFNVLDRELQPFRSANVDVIFTLLLNKIYPTSTTREDERAMLEAEKLLKKFGGINKVLGLKVGVGDVFSGFNIENIKYNNMQPWLIFALNIDLQYQDDACYRTQVATTWTADSIEIDASGTDWDASGAMNL